MATIVYSVAGEGRGHATRSAALIEVLSADHTVHVFAANDAYPFLTEAFAGTSISVDLIPGVGWGYLKNGTMSLVGTARNIGRFLLNWRNLLREYTARVESLAPSLVIADFEPLIANVSSDMGLPTVVLDHQNVVRFCDFSDYSLWIRAQVAYSRPVVGYFHPKRALQVMSSFAFPPVQRRYRHVPQIPTLLRRAVVDAVPSDGEHLTVYVRKTLTDNVAEALRATGRPVEVFGVGARPKDGQLTFYATSPAAFVESLAGCHALVCTAGNQIVGEALYLGKPILAMPDRGLFEQRINGSLLEGIGGGCSVPIETMDSAILGRFLDQRETYLLPLGERERFNGLPAALKIVERVLASGTIGEVDAHAVARA